MTRLAGSILHFRHTFHPDLYGFSDNLGPPTSAEILSQFVWILKRVHPNLNNAPLIVPCSFFTLSKQSGLPRTRRTLNQESRPGLRWSRARQKFFEMAQDPLPPVKVFGSSTVKCCRYWWIRGTSRLAHHNEVRCGIIGQDSGIGGFNRQHSGAIYMDLETGPNIRTDAIDKARFSKTRHIQLLGKPSEPSPHMIGQSEN